MHDSNAKAHHLDGYCSTEMGEEWSDWWEPFSGSWEECLEYGAECWAEEAPQGAHIQPWYKPETEVGCRITYFMGGR